MNDLNKVIELLDVGRVALGKLPLGRMPKRNRGNRGDHLVEKILERHIARDEQTGKIHSVMVRHRAAAEKLARAWQSPAPVLCNFEEDETKRIMLGWGVEVPQPINTFIADLSAGRYPELVARSEQKRPE